MRTGSIARILPIDLVEPDGLVVTADGRYVRVIECERMPNAITADSGAQARIERCFAEICRAIPDGGSIGVYAQTDPIPVDEALAEDKRRVALAANQDRQAGQLELAETRRRLLTAQRQSVVNAAGSEQPAVAARWWVAVPHRPHEDELATRFRQAIVPGGHRTSWRSHQRAAADSLRQTELAQTQLSQAGIEPLALDGVQVLAALWERFHPAARELPDMAALADATTVASATTAEQAGAHRHQILETIARGPCDAAISASDPRWLEHADGTLEEVLHLGTPPLHTSLWWLMHLLACPLPVTVAVHIRVGSREQIRARQRRRWRRLSASIDYKHRRAHLVGAEEHEALAEAELLDSELAGEIGATVYKVSISVAIRDPRGQADAFESLVKETAREFQAHTGARVIRGRWLSLPGFTTTIPVGIDALRATRSYAQRNIAHCLPLTSSSCGSPDGLILGFADPGGTLERINPFDRLYTRHVTLAIGPSGGGKTVTINALLERAISQGMRGWIVDRSSTAADGGGRSSGHYDMLLGLIPGSARVQVGSGTGAVICPWDVADPGQVPPEKEQFLLALHALLIGDQRGGEDRTLSALEESLLLSGIGAVYARCARTGERPRETLLLEALQERSSQEEQGGLVADTLRSLIVRLEPYSGSGAFAHLTDAPTTVPHAADADPVRHRGAARPARPADDPRDRRPHRGTGPTRPLTAAPSGGQRDRRVGRPAVPRRRGGMEADRLGSRRRMAQRVRAALPALRAVADLRLAVLPRPRHPAGARAPGEQGDRALLPKRRRGPRARPRTAGADRHRHRADHHAHDPPRPVLEHLHDLHPRPRRRPAATRRPRVLDLLL